MPHYPERNASAESSLFRRKETPAAKRLGDETHSLDRAAGKKQQQARRRSGAPTHNEQWIKGIVLSNSEGLDRRRRGSTQRTKAAGQPAVRVAWAALKVNFVIQEGKDAPAARGVPSRSESSGRPASVSDGGGGGTWGPSEGRGSSARSARLPRRARPGTRRARVRIPPGPGGRGRGPTPSPTPTRPCPRGDRQRRAQPRTLRQRQSGRSPGPTASTEPRPAWERGAKEGATERDRNKPQAPGRD